MAQTKVNGLVPTAGNGLGPTTYIVEYNDVSLAAAAAAAIGTIAGIDTTKTTMAIQTTAAEATVAALANVTAIHAIFTDN